MNLTKQDLASILWHAKSSLSQTLKEHKIENLLEPSAEAQERVQRVTELCEKVKHFHDKAFDLWTDEVAAHLRETFKKNKGT